jgi:hypothetical protein
MKKEFLKGFTMLTAILVIALASAVITANAQSSRYVGSTIPFEFTVGDTTLPAGEYRITPALGNALAVRNRDANVSVMRLTNEIERRGNKKHSRLVFRQYGHKYFLAEVWSGADATGRQLAKSRKERAIEREFATIASLTGKTDGGYAIVEVAAVLR